MTIHIIVTPQHIIGALCATLPITAPIAFKLTASRARPYIILVFGS